MHWIIGNRLVKLPPMQSCLYIKLIDGIPVFTVYAIFIQHLKLHKPYNHIREKN